MGSDCITWEPKDKMVKRKIDPLFFSQECSDARICLRTGPFCGCGIEKMKREILALRGVLNAIVVFHTYRTLGGTDRRDRPIDWVFPNKALADLEDALFEFRQKERQGFPEETSGG